MIILIAQLVKNLPAMQETLVRFLGWEDPLEKGKATHSSILAWRIPRTVQSMGLQRVGHDLATFTTTSSDQNYLHYDSLPKGYAPLLLSLVTLTSIPPITENPPLP